MAGRGGKRGPGGRPSKLSPEVMNAFIGALRSGNYFETACAFAGICKETAYGWLRKGARGEGKEFVEFLDAVKKAQAHDEVRDIAIITEAAKTQWQAAAWKRERKNPARWGQRIRVTVDQEQSAFLDLLERELPREVYEQVLSVVDSGEDGPRASGAHPLSAGQSYLRAAEASGPPGMDAEGDADLRAADASPGGGDEAGEV